MTTPMSNVVDLVSANSSGAKPSNPSFRSVKWENLKPTDPIVTQFALNYFKKPIEEIPKSSLNRLKAMLRCFPLSQLQLAFGYLGGKSEDLPTTKGVARKAVIDLILANNHLLADATASKSSPTSTAASVNTVVTLSPTKRVNSSAGATSKVKTM